MLRQCPRCRNWLSAHASRCLMCGRELRAASCEHRASSIQHPASATLRTWFQARPRTERLILLLTYADQLSVAQVAGVLELGESYVSETLRCARQEAKEVIAT